MKTYKIPVTWREYGYMIIEADSEEDAISFAHDADLPSDSQYLKDSFEIDYNNIQTVGEVKK